MGNKKRGKGGPRPGMTEQQRAEEVQTMLHMRRAGASYQAIGDHFGLTRENVFRKVRDEIRDLPREEATELRALETAKLDYAETKLQAAIQAGQVGAINTLVRLSESRRKLLGLDMPEQHEVKISREEEALIDQLASALTEQARRRAGEEDTP